MHAWLAFTAGILVVLGSLLILSVSLGIVYYGLDLQSEAILAIILFIVAGIALLLLYVGVKAQRKKIKTGQEALIGAKGIATSDLNPKGEVRVSGEFWQATAKDATINSGSEIEVVDLDGMFLVVRVIEQKA